MEMATLERCPPAKQLTHLKIHLQVQLRNSKKDFIDSLFQQWTCNTLVVPLVD